MNDFDHIYPEYNSRIGAGHPRRIDLMDARRLSKEYETFKIPPEPEIRKLKPGDFVKLARNHERFWVRVSGFIGRRWHGTISNKLTRNKDLSEGGSIFFMRKNIYDLKKLDRSR